MGALLIALLVGSSLTARCPDRAAVYVAGEARRELCVDEAAAAGMTVLDLGDAWTPYALAGAALDAGREPPAYAAAYVALARGRFDDAPEGAIAAADRYLELYGIPPSPSRVLAAMEDVARHRCHDGLDAAVDDALAGVSLPLRYESRDKARTRQAALRRDRDRVAAALRRLRIDDADELATRGRSYADLVARARRAEATDAAIQAIQARLRCDGLLPRGVREGTFDWGTRVALAAFQRRHALVASGELEEDTREHLRMTSRELDLRVALRMLRARVADAAGLIADGSARGDQGQVLGRVLDEPALRYQGAYAPLADGAYDSLSPATEAAAIALGWTSFRAARSWLRRHAGGQARVAVMLPAPPPYLRPGTRLRAEIDAGDVDYDYPYNARGVRLAKPVDRRPVLVLYAEVGGAWIPLVRWPTTIGGWQEERVASGAIVRRYKGSDVGLRHWRELVVAPVWYPPRSTPPDDLVGVFDGRRRLKEELIGPSYRSAYGMVMLVHERDLGAERGDGRWYDAGIRTHGSANYGSILKGSSHGCHRLYNVHVLRLATYILRTQRYAARGEIGESLRRVIRAHGRRWDLEREQRGFLYELDPPIPVEVLPGTPVGARKTPPKGARWPRR